MSNRLLLFMTALVLVGMATLLALNLNSIFTGIPGLSTSYLDHNDVKGMAVEHNKMLYTLNFTQQNDIIDILNRSVKLSEIEPGPRQRPTIEHLTIYRFGADNLVLTPIAYVNNNLIYSLPQWNANGFLMETSNGRLQKLLSQTYDP